MDLSIAGLVLGSLAVVLGLGTIGWRLARGKRRTGWLPLVVVLGLAAVVLALV